MTIPWVVDSLDSTSSTDALSARQGKVLYDYIQDVSHIGHFLALWDASTWLPVTDPETSPYIYNTWDFYTVSVVAPQWGTNYKPDGTQYVIWQASTAVDTDDVAVNDFYFYDGTTWRHMKNSWAGSIAIDGSLSTTSTNPVENRVITNALNGKADATDINTKTFYINWTTWATNIAVAQEAYDWYLAGKNPIISYLNSKFTLNSADSGSVEFLWPTVQSDGPYAWGIEVGERILRFILSNWQVTSISDRGLNNSINYISIMDPQDNAFIPTYDWQPASKKYVDDSISAISITPSWWDITWTLSDQTDLQNALNAKANDSDVVKLSWNQTVSWVKTFNSSPSVPTPTNNSDAATKKYVDDTSSSSAAWKVSDTAYASSWNWVTGVAPSKNAVYDKISAMDTTIAGKQATLSAGTGISLTNNTVTNTWVTSVNWNTWAVTIDEPNTKTFYLSSTSDTTNAQAALDWYLAGKNPIIVYNDTSYITYNDLTSGTLTFRSLSSSRGNVEWYSYRTVGELTIRFNSSNVVTTITWGNTNFSWSYIATDFNYPTPYTPQYLGSPATKKYVDDAIAWVGGWDVLVSDQANNILTSWMKIRAGTQANYEALSSYDNNTVYLTIE